jgi:NTE family protein
MSRRRIRRIDLALQGGGAHGAFTWGVLDRLLEEERIEFEAISGTSAGAMNAVVLADGLMAGGLAGAREALRRFWTRVSRAGGGALAEPFAAFFGGWTLAASPVQGYLDWLGRMFSPQQLNPLDINPLRDIVTSEIDFERVRRCDRVQLFISATHVRTGQLREFRQHEITPDVVMASACLPLLFRAVEIDGEPYWDGGYLGNPSLLPLITESPAHDLMLVQINPSCRETVPTTSQQILDRLNEITFNSSLVKELRSIALLQQLLDDEDPAAEDTRRPLFRQIAALKLHRIDATEALADFGAASKLRTGWSFLQQLYRIGHDTADAWLARHFGHIGRRSTLDLSSYR